eukprot:720003-Rhodomonas_salina.2
MLLPGAPGHDAQAGHVTLPRGCTRAPRVAAHPFLLVAAHAPLPGCTRSTSHGCTHTPRGCTHTHPSGCTHTHTSWVHIVSLMAAHTHPSGLHTLPLSWLHTPRGCTRAAHGDGRGVTCRYKSTSCKHTPPRYQLPYLLGPICYDQPSYLLPLSATTSRPICYPYLLRPAVLSAKTSGPVCYPYLLRPAFLSATTSLPICHHLSDTNCHPLTPICYDQPSYVLSSVGTKGNGVLPPELSATLCAALKDAVVHYQEAFFVSISHELRVSCYQIAAQWRDWAVVSSAISLRARYAVPGTDLAHMVLCACYAMPGTDVARVQFEPGTRQESRQEPAENTPP